jgi:hypothetical protein
MATVETTHAVPSHIVRATGICCRCDSRFYDELVLAIIDPRVPSGVVFIELRHLMDREGSPDDR